MGFGRNNCEIWPFLGGRMTKRGQRPTKVSVSSDSGRTLIRQDGGDLWWATCQLWVVRSRRLITVRGHPFVSFWRLMLDIKVVPVTQPFHGQLLIRFPTPAGTAGSSPRTAGSRFLRCPGPLRFGQPAASVWRRARCTAPQPAKATPAWASIRLPSAELIATAPRPGHGYSSRGTASWRAP